MVQTVSSVTPSEVFAPQARVPVKAVVIGLVVLGVLIGIGGGTPDRIWTTLPLALIILLLAGIGWLVAGWQETVAGWFVSLSLMVVVLLLRFQFDLPGGLILLVIPSALATAMLDQRRGAISTVAATAVAIFCGQRGMVSAAEMIMASATLWSIFVVYWANLRSVYELVHWSWTHYQNAQVALHEVRSGRGQLQQTLDDLAHANRQLALINKRLAAAQLAAEEARKSKAAFVANVSHEFRTPLNMIIGLSDLLIETPHVYGSPIPTLLLEDLEIVRRNSQHLLSMVNDVLDLSQIEANRLALHRYRGNIVEIIDKAVNVVKPLIHKKDIDLKVDAQPDLPEIYCDGTRISQVIVNLLSNAARHTEGGSITIEVRRNGQMVTLAVKDTGPGIPPEEASHIFEPFYRGTFGARRNEGGSGLGLSISKQFIEMHEGDMWLESKVGVGTSFYFSLPIDPLGVAVSGPERWLFEDWRWHQRTESVRLPNEPLKPRILICDANADLQAAFTRFSDKLVYDRVESLEEAVEDLREYPAQTLVINAASPYLLTEAMVRAHQLVSELPIVGCSFAPKVGQALTAGAQGQLQKPITHAELSTILEQMSPMPQRVLVVDDDSDARRLFTRMIEADHPQVQVLTAACGNEALEIMRIEMPDLVLLDIMLPDMDGWQILATKAQDENIRTIPVYLLSAQDPNQQPLTTQMIAVSMSEGLPFHNLLQFTEVLPLLLRHSSV